MVLRTWFPLSHIALPYSLCSGYAKCCSGYALEIMPERLVRVERISFLFFFDHNDYPDEEIQWCEEYRPLLPIETCAREFGH
jgi:hypothetical protein